MRNTINTSGRQGRRRGFRAAGMALAMVGVAGLTLVAARPGPADPAVAATAAEPKGKIDCSKYAGTEKEACEKMMSRRRS